MPLINIQTNLKSLTYSEFGSDDPLVTKDINKNPSTSGINMEADKRVDDLKRVTKLLTKTPAALKFAANQATLNTLEQRIKSNKKGKLAGDIIRGVGNTVKVLASTLAQVPVSGTGTHFVKGFAGKNGYLKGVQGHIQYKNRGRQDGIINTTGIIEKTGELEENKSNIVLDYFNIPQGGLNRRGEFTKAIIDSGSVKEVSGSFSLDATGSSNYWNGSPLTNVNSNSFILGSNDDIKFGAGFNESDPNEAFDVITARAPETSSIIDASTIDITTAKLFQDLIKFRFKIITPPTSDGENAEPLVTHLTFRAFLDSFDDSHSASWNNFNYIGRGEQFHTYGGYDRSINFSFKLAALSKEELNPMYDKLNLLAGHLAPTYVGDSFMRGNFIAVTIGDYINNQLGFMNSVTITWNTDYPFGPSNTADDGEVPHILDIDCSFVPIHKFNTQFGERFIFPQGTEAGSLIPSAPTAGSTENTN